MSRERVLLAWQDDHDDHDAGNVVVFARTQLQARAKVARERGMALEEAAVVRRPEFDAHAPGPVPAEVLLANGWWLECGHCSHEIREGWCEDGCVDDDAPVRGVCVGTEAYCTETCRTVRETVCREDREGRARVRAAVDRHIPGSTVDFIWRDASGWAARLFLPGMLGRATWRESAPDSLEIIPTEANIRIVRELRSAPAERWESEGGSFAQAVTP